jgi:hypothetical protein
MQASLLEFGVLLLTMIFGLVLGTAILAAMGYAGDIGMECAGLSGVAEGNGDLFLGGSSSPAACS